MATITKASKGETLKFPIMGSDIESAKIVLVGPTAQAPSIGKLEVDFVQDPDSLNCWNAVVETSLFVPGHWSYEIWKVCDSVNVLHLRSPLEIGDSLLDAPAGTDTRSHAEKVVSNIELYLEGNSASLVRRYKINNRELERYSMPEILNLLKFYRRELANERRKSAGSKKTGRRYVYKM